MPQSFAIALDVGGSSIKSGIIASGDTGVNGVRTDLIDSYGNAETILSTLENVIRSHIALISNHPLRGVGIGFPGPFDYAEGVCRMRGISPNCSPVPRGKYDAIYGLDLRSMLRQRLGLPGLAIEFLNDAETAILGEVKYGAGKGYRRLIGVTLGTGLGSAFFSDGVRQTGGPGVPPNGWLFSQSFMEKQADDAFSTRGMLEALSAGGARHASIGQAAEAARAGDEATLHVFRWFGEALGTFLRPFVLGYSAQSVLALGGIANTFDLFGPSLNCQLPVPALSDKLGANAALLGAVDSLMSRSDQQ